MTREEKFTEVVSLLEDARKTLLRDEQSLYGGLNTKMIGMSLNTQALVLGIALIHIESLAKENAT